MNDLGIKTKHPIVVTNWTNEEGARFAPAMLASGVFAGVHTLDYAYGRKDPEGKTFGDELKRIGWLGDEEVGARKMHAYFEYHIEQGPILEAEDKQIGVVTHWPGPVVAGIHADRQGSPYRLDADEPARQCRARHGAASWKWCRTWPWRTSRAPSAASARSFFSPNSRNVLPGKVVFTVDIRSPDQAKLDRMRAKIEAEAPKICEALGVGCAIEAVGHFDPVTFDPALVAAVRNAAERARLQPHGHHLRRRPRRLLGGQGGARDDDHLPLRRRLSHNEAEEISKEWAAAGGDVLFHAVVETAEIVE